MTSTSAMRNAAALDCEVEWEKAQEIEISVNLLSEAKKELRFLALAHRTAALRNPQVQRRGVERYVNCWLPLLSKFGKDVLLIPPLDCAWIWHCHKLNPVQYGNDCQELFGKLLDMRSDDTQDSNSSANSELLEDTFIRWQNSYPNEPYVFIQSSRYGQNFTEQDLPFGGDSSAPSRRLAFDLVAAVERQQSFYYQVCRPWMSDDRYLTGSLERYKSFLYIIKRSLESGVAPFIVPTYDIDLLWHSHQLCPTAYRADTIKCMGAVLDHDDTDRDRAPGQRLQTSFLKTCGLWQATFGKVYERAGAMHRGQEPTPVPPPPLEDPNRVVTGYPVTVQTQSGLPPLEIDMDDGNVVLSRTPRKTMQVHLVLYGAKNIPQKPGKNTHCYVRITALRRCPRMKLTTALVAISLSNSTTEVHWNQEFSMVIEVATVGLKLELMKYSTFPTEGNGKEGCLVKMKKRIHNHLSPRAKCVGEVVVKWRTDLLDLSRGLSLSRWSTVLSQGPAKKSKGRGSDGDLIPDPELHFSVSVTPPSSAAYILRMLHAPVTDDSGLQVARKVPYPGEKRQEGRWVTRAVTDHRGEEQFVVRTRFARGLFSMLRIPREVTGDEKIIVVHQGGMSRQREWNYHGQFLVRALGPVVGIARQLPFSVEHGQSSLRRHWSLFQDTATLTVNRPDDSSWSLDCHIQGNLGSPLRLLPGKRLEYEMRDGPIAEATTSSEDHKFMTLVRYTSDYPFGKATGLINWQTGSMEVMPEESVTLVLLITSAIASSLVDMDHPSFGKASLFHSLPESVQSKIARGNINSHSDGDLGAILIQRNGAFSQGVSWEKSSMHLYSNWWNLTDSQIIASGDFGGTLCTSGACSGGACGGGGCTFGVGSVSLQLPNISPAM